MIKFHERIQFLKILKDRGQAISKYKLQRFERKAKNAIKAELTKRFDMKFLTAWSGTVNFKCWVVAHDQRIANLSDTCGRSPNNTVYYDNGDIYSGGLLNGKRHGEGMQAEYLTGLVYNGGWEDDLRQGYGNLSSKNQDYIYDGGWVKGMK